MTYITSNQGRPVQGVSQQPDKNRYPGQCTQSDNFRPDVVRGLITRQGTTKTGTLTGASQNPLSKWHHYKRNDEEYFIEIQPNGTLQAWSPDGTAHTITVEDSSGTYLACTDPSSSLELLTVGDYTFIINKDTTVAEGTTTADALDNTSIVYVQYKDYTQYTYIYIDNVMVAWHLAEKGDNAEDISSTKPATVAAQLYEGLQGRSGGPTAEEGSWGGTDITATYDIELASNCIFISKKDGTDYDIYVDDDVNNANAVALYKEIEQVTLLPNRAPENFRIKVNPPGGETTENASYWLQATSVDGSSGNTLQWKETLEPEIVLGYDLSTMPHVLVRESVTNGVASFTLREGEWEDREVGDDDTNPLPTFVDEEIKSMGIMQNRLYFTAGESVIMSRSGHFFNFFRATAQAALDTDPIDIYADSEQINYLEASMAFDGDVVFFSKSAQFILPGDKALTAANAVLRKTTNFETNLDVKPVASGDSILFAINYGRYTGIREYFTDSVTDTKMARPITDHVKEYIAGSPEIMVASTNLNILAVKAEADHILYLYDWLWQGAEKVQSAWGRIVFNETDVIEHLAFVDDALRIVIRRDGGDTYCETIDLGDADSTGLDFPVRLDRRSDITFTWDETDEVWKTDDPLPDVDVNEIRIVRSTDCYESEKGTLANIERQSYELWCYDDLSEEASCTCIAGIPYTCTYVPTNPVVKDQNNQAMNLDKLTVGAFYINYNTTGDITATVTDIYGRERTSEYGNRVFGNAANIVGFATLTEGQHRIPIRAKSDKYTLTIKTESHIPLTIRDFSFNGNLNRRGMRI
jgi:hypothetical protein